MYTTQEQIRENCPICGDTKGRLYIKKIAGGILRHCHNENCYKDSPFVPNKNKTPKEIFNNIKPFLYSDLDIAGENTVLSEKEISLPYDFTLELPKEAERWLSSSGITDKEALDNMIGYSPYMNRIILPVYQDKKVVYFQGRALGAISKTNPKYLNLRNTGAKDIYFKINNYSKLTSLVIVEDILSAIKIGRHCNVLALLGSYFPANIYHILKEYELVFIWLDADKYTTALKEAKRLKSITSSQIKTIYTVKDPKEYSDTVIKTILNLD